MSYSLYVGAADAARAMLGGSPLDGLRSPAGIAVQLAMLAVLLKVDWRLALARRRPPAETPTSAPS